MKTAKEWFKCLRPDLRDRAIKAIIKEKALLKYYSFSSALIHSFDWDKEGDYSLWNNIYEEALYIEQRNNIHIRGHIL